MQEPDLFGSITEWTRDNVDRLGHDPTNAASLGRIVQRYVRDVGGDVRAASLMRWLADESKTKRPRTVRNQLCAVRSWGRWMHASGLTASPMFETVRAERCVSDDGTDAISADQAELLISRARAECFSPRWQTRWNAPARLAAYVLMLEVGFRVGEVRAQRWRDVDLVSRTIRISRDKSRRQDVVELGRRPAAILRWLRMRQREAGLLSQFVCPNGPNAKKIRGDLDAIGCVGEPGRFHRLRKYAITRRAMEGWDVWSLTYFARHRDPKTTMRYVRPHDGVRSSVVPKFSRG